jgi:hypothetical protein
LEGIVKTEVGAAAVIESSGSIEVAALVLLVALFRFMAFSAAMGQVK